uniref:Uncharacterized protein n=1 Tax=Toxoplasma gondii TgCATBr9 TaxID=943120 RepID=A0A2T6IN28_TOXGO|nr:hypothetical protein TGBR9_383370 [Toxoplasma gondii TgCATBr9]
MFSAVNTKRPSQFSAHHMQSVFPVLDLLFSLLYDASSDTRLSQPRREFFPRVDLPTFNTQFETQPQDRIDTVVHMTPSSSVDFSSIHKARELLLKFPFVNCRLERARSRSPRQTHGLCPAGAESVWRKCAYFCMNFHFFSAFFLDIDVYSFRHSLRRSAGILRIWGKSVLAE